MPEVEVSAGPIEYGDSGGEGRPLVLIGGLPHDESLWDGVIAELAPAFRCLTPVLPLAPHERDGDEGEHDEARLRVPRSPQPA